MNSKGCLTIVGLIIVVLLGISFFLPKDMNITVTKQLNASPDQIFAQVNDVKNWKNWSPWWDLDPEMEVEYGDITVGEGASYSWKSDKRSVGNGSMVINESTPYQIIGTTLKFEGTDDSYADMIFTELQNGGTEVAWDFKADYDAKMPWSRYMMAFYRTMLSKSYNKGLESLDAYIAEHPDAHLDAQPEQALNLTIEVKEVPGFNAVTVNRKGKISVMQSPEGQAIYAGAMEESGEIIAENGWEVSGAPLAFGVQWDEEKDSFEMEIGMPVREGGQAHEGGKVVAGSYYGPYEGLEQTHGAIYDYMVENELEMRGSPWESYVTDPGLEPDTTKWLTIVHYPVD